MLVDILIIGGMVVIVMDMFDVDVVIDGEEIVVVGDVLLMLDVMEMIDVEGLFVMFGMIDLYVYIDDMFLIDIYEMVLVVVVFGGVIFYVDFVWQVWMGELFIFEEGGMLLEGIECKCEKVVNVYVDYVFYGVIICEDLVVLLEFVDVVDVGVFLFKMFIIYEYGFLNGFMYIVMEEIVDIDVVGVYYIEDVLFIDVFIVWFKVEGCGDLIDYLQLWLDYVEVMVVEDVVWMV